MKRIWIIWACLILWMAGTACEKEIEFDGEERASKLTISAMMDAGKPITIYVSSSVFFLNSPNNSEGYTAHLDTARGQVRVFVNDANIAKKAELIPDTDWYYSYSLCYGCDYVPVPGDRIRIEAEFPGYDAVWAETVVPFLPRFEVVSVSPENCEMTIRIDDDAAFDKYYYLHLHTHCEDVDGTIYDMRIPFTSSDVLFRNVSSQLSFGGLDYWDSEEWVDYYLFPDELIKGKSYSFKIKWHGIVADQGEGIYVDFSTVTDSFYWYVTSYETLRNSDGGLFGEGVTLYCNVKGGYGVVGAYSSETRVVEW
ncbi:MAG: DUF4249 domain-containing protein [Bacteroidales bacterium]|nr:DUF4249 domain-containing protein [Bacteroidales bacterium]